MAAPARKQQQQSLTGFARGLAPGTAPGVKPGVFSPAGAGLAAIAAALRDEDEEADDEVNVKAFLSQTHTKGLAAKMHERRELGAAPPALAPKARPSSSIAAPGHIQRYLQQVHPATNSNPFLPPRRRKGGVVRPAAALHLREDGTVSRFQKNFEVLSVLGSGSFSDVLRCRSRMDGCAYAVKRRRDRVVLRNGGWMADGAPNAARRNELKEVHAMAVLAHEHILRYYVAWREDDQMYIQTELAWGSLEDAVRGLRPSNASSGSGGRVYVPVAASLQQPGGADAAAAAPPPIPAAAPSSPSAPPPAVPPKTRARPLRPPSTGDGADSSDGDCGRGAAAPPAFAASDSEDPWERDDSQPAALLLRRRGAGARADPLFPGGCAEGEGSSARRGGVLDFSEDAAATESECVLPQVAPVTAAAAVGERPCGGGERPRATSALSDSARAASPLVALPSAPLLPRPSFGSPVAKRAAATAASSASLRDLPASGAGSKRKQASVQDLFLRQQQVQAHGRGAKQARIAEESPLGAAAGDESQLAPASFMPAAARPPASPAKRQQQQPASALCRGLSSASDGSFVLQRPGIPPAHLRGGAGAEAPPAQYSSFSQAASQWESFMPPQPQAGDRPRGGGGICGRLGADSVPASFSSVGAGVAQPLFGCGSQDAGFLSRGRLNASASQAGASPPPPHVDPGVAAGSEECYSQAMSIVVTQEPPRRGSRDENMRAAAAAPPYRLAEEDVLALLFDICSALAHVHRLGLAHLDVKPANILVVYSCGMVDAEGDWLPEACALTGTLSGDAALLSRLEAGGALALAAEAQLQQQSRGRSDGVTASRGAVALDLEVLRRMPPCLTYKLGDFGQCSVLGADDVAEGDSRYLAQELLVGDTSNLPAADIFSLALSAVELAGGFHLPSGDDDYQALRHGELPWGLLTHLSEPLRDLLSAMAAQAPSQRPTAQAILDHPALIAHRLRQCGAARPGVLQTLGESGPRVERPAAVPAVTAEPSCAGMSDISVALDRREECSDGPVAPHSETTESGSSARGHHLRDPGAAAAGGRTAASLPAICALLASIDELLGGSPGSGLAETRILGVVAALTPFSAGPTPLHGRAASGDGSGSGSGGRSFSPGLSDCAIGAAAAEGGAGGGQGGGVGLAWSPPGHLGGGGAVATPFSPGLRVRELSVGGAAGPSISVQPAGAAAGGPVGLVLSAAAVSALRQDLHALLDAAGVRLPAASASASSGEGGTRAPAKTPLGGGFKAGGGPGPVTVARAALAPSAEYSPEI